MKKTQIKGTGFREGDVAFSLFLEEEIKNLKLVIIAYTVFIVFAIIGFLWGRAKGLRIMADWQFGIMVASNLLSSGFAVLAIHFKKEIFLVKYILLSVMAAVITVGIVWTGSIWIFLGFYLLLAMTGLFFDWRTPIFTGLVCLFFFSFIIFPFSFFEFEEVMIWLVYFLPMLAVVSFIGLRNHNFLKNLLEKQEKLEEGQATLEVRVRARTKELSDLSAGLEKQVEERTKALQQKVEELEKFQKLVVGRELKMLELKKKIEKLTKN